MTDVPIFGSFDKDAETDIESRYLPHWFQPGVAVFITFRTADSLPRNVVLKWDAELRDWLAQAGFQIGSNAPLPSVESYLSTCKSRFRNIGSDYGIGNWIRVMGIVYCGVAIWRKS